jgi:hypothetical protein
MGGQEEMKRRTRQQEKAMFARLSARSSGSFSDSYRKTLEQAAKDAGELFKKSEQSKRGHYVSMRSLLSPRVSSTSWRSRSLPMPSERAVDKAFWHLKEESSDFSKKDLKRIGYVNFDSIFANDGSSPLDFGREPSDFEQVEGIRGRIHNEGVENLPPIAVKEGIGKSKGKYYLEDGHHRVIALYREGVTNIPALIFPNKPR